MSRPAGNFVTPKLATSPSSAAGKLLRSFIVKAIAEAAIQDVNNKTADGLEGSSAAKESRCPTIPRKT